MDFIIKTEQDREKVLSYIGRLPLREKGHKLKIARIAPQRSNEQNAYMHYVFGMIAKETGHTMQEIKDEYKKIFLTVPAMIMGKETTKVRDTRDLTTLEQEDFMVNVRHHADQFLGMFIPLPNERIPEEHGH